MCITILLHLLSHVYISLCLHIIIKTINKNNLKSKYYENDLTTLTTTNAFHVGVMVVDSNGKDTGKRKTVVFSSNDVASVYSGKIGCMCGCNGNHKYHPGHVEESSKKRGYDISHYEISLLSVKRMSKKFAYLPNETVKVYESNESILFIKTDTRINAINLF